MPKIKTCRAAKKRFSLTSKKKVVSAHSGKRHGMVKRTNKQVRNLRGTCLVAKCNVKKIKKFELIC